ncbi:hypothetical protein [Sneathiella chinensis]|uniref:Uncharacterized protein n=1 Tax=Sneathiella chinensis TaxID=349750 RepID=A0ABQ5U7E3_9PROT|nr:hypothetical protein [Sneathiella chinensis]GLQ07341.1 hypothetical protein GCM10007924_25620 [Sneathiella chinensis]
MPLDIHMAWTPERHGITLTGPEDLRPLMDFMDTELQQDTAYARYLIDHINGAEETSFKLSGNSYNLLINNDNFKIENLFSPTETCTGKTADLLALLREWLSLMDRKDSL